MEAPSLWATCILPGCRQPVATELEVCDTCRTAFADYLRETDRPPSYTIADIEARDADVKAAYLAQFALRSAPAEIDTASKNTAMPSRSPKPWLKPPVRRKIRDNAAGAVRAAPHLHPQGTRLGMPRMQADPLSITDPRKDRIQHRFSPHHTTVEENLVTVTIVSGDDCTAPRIGRFGADPSEERAQAPFTEDHRTALLEVAVCSGPQGGRVDACIHAEEWVGACLHLEDGMLVWDAGVGRPSFAAVRGIDGMYVEVLTAPTGSTRGTTLAVEADWPISLELPRETARTIWYLIAVFTI